MPPSVADFTDDPEKAKVMKMARRERIKTREKVEQKWPRAEEDAAAAAEEVAVEEEEEASIEVALTAEEVAALRRVGAVITADIAIVRAAGHPAWAPLP